MRKIGDVGASILVVLLIFSMYGLVLVGWLPDSVEVSVVMVTTTIWLLIWLCGVFIYEDEEELQGMTWLVFVIIGMMWIVFMKTMVFPIVVTVFVGGYIGIVLMRMSGSQGMTVERSRKEDI